MFEEFFLNISSKTPTISRPSSDTGNTRRSSSVLSGTPCDSNHSLTFLGPNLPYDFLIKSHHLAYLVASISLSSIPVVTLQRPPQDMMTFLPGEVFFSKRCIWIFCSTDDSRIVAAAMSPLAPAPMIATFFIWWLYRKNTLCKKYRVKKLEMMNLSL